MYDQRDELNVTRASRVLEADHLGLQDVKRQVLEFIAVAKLKDSQSGQEGGGDASRSIASKVLCLIGPPG